MADALTVLLSAAFVAGVIGLVTVVVGFGGWLWRKFDDWLWRRRWRRWFERGSREDDPR